MFSKDLIQIESVFRGVIMKFKYKLVPRYIGRLYEMYKKGIEIPLCSKNVRIVTITDRFAPTEVAIFEIVEIKDKKQTKLFEQKV